MKVVNSEYGHTLLHESGRAIAHARDRALLQSYMDDLGSPAAPAPAATVAVKHTVRFWAVEPLEGERLPRKSDMKSADWGWDATCACGWDSQTGGAKMSHVDRLVAEHKAS